ncbi:hypothetical protein GCK32_022118 [Trichostrongylus colubriformis]|uniref:Uncharacterized protein n=1 Tax=Trichostrongylus colubriformis TaxID=6319 RepID=A0AAN8I8H1_TRICO
MSPLNETTKILFAETTGMEKSDEVKTAKVPRYPLFSTKSTRLRICMMLTTGLFVTVSMRLDLSMAIVCMVNSTAFTSHHSTSDSLPNTTTAPPRCYSLNYDQQSAVQAGYTVRIPKEPNVLRFYFIMLCFCSSFLTTPQRPSGQCRQIGNNCDLRMSKCAVLQQQRKNAIKQSKTLKTGI